MAEPNRTAVKKSLKSKIAGTVKAAFGGRKANQDIAKLTEFVAGPASSSVAGVIQAVPDSELPAEVVKARKDIRTALESETGYLVMARRNLSQGRALQTAIVSLKKIDFIAETSTGQRALALEGKLGTAIAEYATAEAAAVALVAKVPLMTTEADCQPYYDFIGTSLKVSGDFQKLLAEVRYSFENMIEFESIKAWVKGNPDEENEVLENRLWLVDQGINGADVVADGLGKVPEPYTQAAAEGLKLGLRLVRIAKAFGDKYLRSRDAERQIAKYQQEHVKGVVLDEHDDNPAMMAEMLFKKHRANLEIALVMADQAIGTAATAVPLLDSAWGQARGRIADAYEAYQEARIKPIRKALEEAQQKDPQALSKPSTREKVAQLGLDALKLFKDNVFDILHPLDALMKKGMDKISQQIFKIIFEKFPPDPAQAIDGAALQGMVSEVQDSFLNGLLEMPQLSNASQAGPTAARARDDRPEKDSEGRVIESFLGAVETDDGKRYRFVKIDGRRGALYLDTLEFKADGGPQLNPVEADLLSLVPDKDHKGRPIAEVDLSVGFVTKNTVSEPGVQLSGSGIRVRVGPLWGYIDQKTKIFYPVDVESSGYASWSTRTLVDDGYRENGADVKGKWYRPWKSRPNEYLFVGPKGNEWASALQSTARGQGSSFNVGSCLERVKLDPIELSAI